MNDWCWRKLYKWADFQREFPTDQYPRAARVQPKGGLTLHAEDNKPPENPEKVENDLVEVYFYENRAMDKMAVQANNEVIDMFPLPYKHKDLSLVWAFWTMRSETCIYGIGILEAMMQDQEMYDKINNMSVDQLVLSIWKPYMYSPSEELDIMNKYLEPGKGIKVNDPKNIQFMEIPGNTNEVYHRLEMIRDNIDESTGITKTLSGDIIGKTVYEAEQNRQAGLRKLSVPITGLETAMQNCWNLLIPLARQVYAQPEIKQKLTGPDGLKAYEAIMNSARPDLVQADPNGMVTTFQNRMMRMPVEIDDDMNSIATDSDKDVELSEALLKWEGKLQVKAFSMLPEDPYTKREEYKELYLILYKSPNADIYKLDKELVKMYNRNPDDLLQTEQEIAMRQQQAAMAREQQAAMAQAQGAVAGPEVTSQGAQMEQPAPTGPLPQDIPPAQVPELQSP